MVSDGKLKAMEMEKQLYMKEVTKQDYEEFVKHNKILVFKDCIGKREVKIKIGRNKKIEKFQPDSFEVEGATLWSYPRRGRWATHKGDFRGNWPPQMARNLILRYSKKGETVLDQMVGSGTTLIECKLLGRNGIGVDINPKCIMLTRDRLHFSYNSLNMDVPQTTQKTFVGDARNIDKIQDESIDLIATHPPYVNIIPYSKKKREGDLSNVHSIAEYTKEMKKVAKESYRVLKPGRYCAILVGDTRRNKHYVPIAFRVMQAFLDIKGKDGGQFILKEDVVKHQWRCKATGFWLKKSKKYNFLLIMHENLFIFRKPEEGEDLDKFEGSIKWWHETI